MAGSGFGPIFPQPCGKILRNFDIGAARSAGSGAGSAQCANSSAGIVRSAAQISARVLRMRAFFGIYRRRIQASSSKAEDAGQAEAVHTSQGKISYFLTGVKANAYFQVSSFPQNNLTNLSPSCCGTRRHDYLESLLSNDSARVLCGWCGWCALCVRGRHFGPPPRSRKSKVEQF